MGSTKAFNSLIEFRMNDLRVFVPVIDIDQHLRVYISKEIDQMGLDYKPSGKYSIQLGYYLQSKYCTFSLEEQRS